MICVNKKRWEGNLLCTVAYKLIKNGENSWLEPYMFTKVSVKDNMVIFPCDVSVPAEPFYELAAKGNLWLKEVIEEYIKSSPTLHKKCIKNRVGYTPVESADKGKITYGNESRKQEFNFIVKVLKSKKDRDNLKAYLAENKRYAR